MRSYETVIVIDSLLKSEEIDSIINKYERFISANGGKIETMERWGKKRLAYEIKKRQYGYYVLIGFQGPPTMIKPLEREYRLNESLLRYKILLVPKQLLEQKADSDIPTSESEKKDTPDTIQESEKKEEKQEPASSPQPEESEGASKEETDESPEEPTNEEEPKELAESESDSDKKNT